MEVMIDGIPASPPEDSASTVFDLVVSIGKQLQEQGRSIMAVEVDGNHVNAEQLVASMKDKPLTVVHRILITSKDTQALVQESLSEIERTLPELPLACQELAKVFQSETPDAGYEPFQHLAAIWSVLKERELMVANALEMPLEELMIGDLSVEAFHDDLNKYLREATDALKAKDSVLLSDLLEYELAPRAEKEAQIVAILKEEAERHAR